MVRRIIRIDEDKCTGCKICTMICHEGAVAVIGGKARLIRDDLCDGFGDCISGCRSGAISFIEKDTLEYDEDAAAENRKKLELEKKKRFEKMNAQRKTNPSAGPEGCPENPAAFPKKENAAQNPLPGRGFAPFSAPSQLRQWPCQIKLVPVNAPYFDGAKLLIAADCTAFAYANIHQEFMRGKVTLIGCPKLDGIDYSEKLTAIISKNDIKELTILRMEVPCCAGLERAAVAALKSSGKFIPWQVITFTIDGKIKD